MTQELIDRLALRQSYRTLFDAKSEHGQRVLRHLMRVGFVTRCPFVAGDPHETAMNIGMQRIVQSILKFVYGSDEAIRRAIEESHKQEES